MKKFYMLALLMLLSGLLLAQAPKRPAKPANAPAETVQNKKAPKAAADKTKSAKPEAKKTENKKPETKKPEVKKTETKKAEKTATTEKAAAKPDKNEFVMPTGYDYVGTPHAFKKNWCEVRRNNKTGFTDQTGQEVVPTRYDRVDPFDAYKRDGQWCTATAKAASSTATERRLRLPCMTKSSRSGSTARNGPWLS